MLRHYWVIIQDHSMIGEETGMPKKPSGSQSGGINVTGGTIATAGGHLSGRNTKITYTPAQVSGAMQPIADAIKMALPKNQVEATTHLDSLKMEVSKGAKAKDKVVARLVKGLVNLVPSATSSIVSAFGTPILGEAAGEATKLFLNELGDQK